MREPSKKPIHYVSNIEFFAAVKAYKELYNEAKEAGLPVPKIPPYIGECLFKIATKLSYSPNFIGYSFRDEMIADGLENCVTYFHNFNPDKSSNPFSYFTQIIYFAFLRRIQKEKKQVYIKHKVYHNQMTEGGMHSEHEGSGESHDVPEHEDTEYINDFVKIFESKMEAKKNAKKKKNAELIPDELIESGMLADLIDEETIIDE